MCQPRVPQLVQCPAAPASCPVCCTNGGLRRGPAARQGRSAAGKPTWPGQGYLRGLPITTALRWALGRAPPASVRRPGSRDGISYAGGVGIRDDPHQVHVAELDLRPTERFVYDYDFTDGWRLDLCLEQILAAEAGRVYPRCTGGRRAAPPEASGGALAFLEQTQPHHVLARDRPCGRDSEPAPGSQRTSRGSASTATNSRPFSRCWVWTGSTGGQRTVPW